MALLKASHQRGRHPAKPLPTAPVARALLDQAFEKFCLIDNDANGHLRRWLANTFQPDAIRMALAILEDKKAKGNLISEYAHRYLVTVIVSMQIEVDLEREGVALLHYAETERSAWLSSLVAAKKRIEKSAKTDEELVLGFAEQALYGGIILEKAFWEKELTLALFGKPDLTRKVMTHIRRLYEAPELCRQRLLNRLVAGQAELLREVV